MLCRPRVMSKMRVTGGMLIRGGILATAARPGWLERVGGFEGARQGEGEGVWRS